ncbi:MAG: isopentenyl-diphosphate Delta-isomerase [Candidatus Woesearchaeota archaeon]
MKDLKKKYVLLVNERNQILGKLEKLEAHKKGLLHRAFSIFVFNEKKELLLQKRAEKYHSSYLWSNTCCSHPISEDEKLIKKEAEKRLLEEMGFTCSLEKKFTFIYRAKLDNNLIEHEYDIVFFGFVDSSLKIVPNKQEVIDYKWISLGDLKRDIEKNNENYTPWLRIIIDDVISLL